MCFFQGKAQLFTKERLINNENFDKAASIYGVNEPTTFVIGDGGNIGFGVGEEVINYSDFNKPFAKDFKTVNTILEKTNTLFSKHQELNPHAERALRAELTGMLNNPKAGLASGIFYNFSSFVERRFNSYAGEFHGFGIDKTSVPTGMTQIDRMIR